MSVISRKTPVEGSAPGLACPGWDSASFLEVMHVLQVLLFAYCTKRYTVLLQSIQEI